MTKKLKKIIGFVGLGIMGKPMVKNLLKSIQIMINRAKLVQNSAK